MLLLLCLASGLNSTTQFIWDEDCFNTYNQTLYGQNINTQFVKVFFVDLENDVEAIGEDIVDAKLPYERVYLTQGSVFALIKNHMVGSFPA